MVTPVYDPIRQYLRHMVPKPIPVLTMVPGTEDNPVFDTTYELSSEWEVLDHPQEHIDAELSRIRSEIVVEIKRIRDTRTQTGGFPAAGYWFHSDVFSRSQQLGLVLLGANIPNNLYWKTMSGDMVLMTQTLTGQIFQAAATQDATTFSHAEALISQVNSAYNPYSVNINTGWPPIYGD